MNELSLQNKNKTFFPFPRGTIFINIQAFLQEPGSVPLSMKHQYLHANIEAQVTIASIILVGVYVLIILEVSHVLCFGFIFWPTLQMECEEEFHSWAVTYF